MDTPTFKNAVASETAFQQAQGKSPAKAQEVAVRKVTRQYASSEKERREEQVAPLVEALKAFERPRGGCWAYNTTTTRQADGNTTVMVERFDPFQPEERLWTLLGRDGSVPDEKTQAGYRRAKLKAWQKELDRKPSKYPEAKSLKWSAIADDATISGPDPDGRTTFTFQSSRTELGVADLVAPRKSYTIDANLGAVLRRTATLLEPMSVGVIMTFQTSETATDYVLIEPMLPPFPAKVTAHYRAKIFGNDSGDVRMEILYSDYRRVKCYDDRFGVQIGEPNIVDFMPERK